MTNEEKLTDTEKIEKIRSVCNDILARPEIERFAASHLAVGCEQGEKNTAKKFLAILDEHEGENDDKQ